MLSEETARQIVRAVVRDSKSRKRIDSTLARVMPDRLGITGSLRNLGMIAMNLDPTDPTVSALTCVGISDTASDAIAAANIPGVKLATSRNRNTWNTAHTATQIDMEDGSMYVFDWHATLNSSDPLISKAADWDAGKTGIRFSVFKGFD